MNADAQPPLHPYSQETNKNDKERIDVKEDRASRTELGKSTIHLPETFPKISQVNLGLI